MFGALATDAKFVGANLRFADLELMELEGADLSDAVLEGAMVRRSGTAARRGPWHESPAGVHWTPREAWPGGAPC